MAAHGRSLHCCQLRKLPEEIGKCTAMIWLAANANRLASLPHSIGNLTGLVSHDRNCCCWFDLSQADWQVFLLHLATGARLAGGFRLAWLGVA